jgi:hypothetical protein
MENKVKEILTETGWFINRGIDVTELIAFLVDCDYKVFDNAKRFLREYGLLKITYINYRSGNYANIYVDTRNIIADKSVLDAYGRYYGTIMVPVAVKSHLQICISEDGQFYGGFDQILLKLGDSFEEVLYNLITDAKLEKVYVDLNP